MILHACVFMAYNALTTLVESWSEKCSTMLVVEHPADGKTKRVHCHFLLEHSYSDDEVFRKLGKACLGEFFKRGNYWIATRVQKGEHAGKLLQQAQLMDYFLKGKYTESFVKNISEEILETSRSRWVETVKSDTSDDGSSTEIMICKVVDVVEAKLNQRLYNEDEAGIELYRETTVMDLCRSEAFKMLWGKRRVAPHASHYKIVASSAFMRIMENHKCFEKGIAVLKDLWY